MIRKISHTL